MNEKDYCENCGRLTPPHACPIEFADTTCPICDLGIDLSHDCLGDHKQSRIEDILDSYVISHTQRDLLALLYNCMLDFGMNRMQARFIMANIISEVGP